MDAAQSTRVARRWALRSRPAGLSAGPAAVVGLCLALAASVSLHGAWSRHVQQQRVAAYQGAQRALPHLVLPTELQPVTTGAACQTTSVERCATSAMTPAELQPVLTRLVGGHSLNASASCLGGQCPVEVQGTLRGSPVLVIAWRHLVDSRKEAVPAGAVPVKATTSVMFWTGSDVVIELVSPKSRA